MSVSEKDRAYFARIGKAKAAAHRESQRAHAKLSLDERLARSAAFCRQYRKAGRPETQAPAIYERARALGLYKP